MELCMVVLWVLPISIPISEIWNCASLYCEFSPLLYLYQRYGTVHVCTVSSPHSYTCSEIWNYVCLYCEFSLFLYLVQRYWTVHVCTVSSPHYYTCIRDMEQCMVVLWVLPITIPISEIWNCACLYCEFSPFLYLFQRYGTVHGCTVSSPHYYTCIRDMELCMFVLWVLPITIPVSEVWNCACLYCEFSPFLYLYQRYGTMYVCTVSSPHSYTCIRDIELCMVACVYAWNCKCFFSVELVNS